jgi:type VI secretion system protein ImpK
MEQDYYEINIGNWTNSIVEREKMQQRPSDSLIPLGNPTYYRTKAFSSYVGINNLINAADPIITLVTKLRRITMAPDIAILYQNICHEIKAFENKAETMGYRPPFIFAARYILCAFLDEFLAISLWPEMESKQYSLIEAFHKEMLQEERFFLILERSLQDPADNIDLLELIYLCLCLGYEGKYRSLERGHYELRKLRDHLYHIITQYRDEFSRSLFIGPAGPNYQATKQKNYLHLLPSAWLVSTIMVLLLLIVFGYFYTKLIAAAAPISHFLNTIAANSGYSEPTS